MTIYQSCHILRQSSNLNVISCKLSSMNRTFSVFACAGLVGATLCLSSSQGIAQIYPAKPVRMIQSLGVGGGSDPLARLMSQNRGTHYRRSVARLRAPTGLEWFRGTGRIARADHQTALRGFESYCQFHGGQREIAGFGFCGGDVVARAIHAAVTA